MGVRCGTLENWWEVGVLDMLSESCGRRGSRGRGIANVTSTFN